MADKIRTFICIEIPDEIISLLGAVQQQLRGMCRSARWVRLEGIHLTLKFLGDVEPEQLETIHHAIRLSVADTVSFPLVLGRPGAFPNLRRPRVLFFSLKDPSHRLIECQRAIEEALEPLGFAAEKRSFSPHLTLARIKVPGEAASLSPHFERMDSKAVEFKVHEVVIKKSDLRPTGAVYSTLRRVGLAP
jgi:2'-5' RNA ligase